MYGTVARLRVKPGMLAQLQAAMRDEDADLEPRYAGYSAYVYQMDSNPNELYLVVMFPDRESYFANANSPEQHQSYLKMMECLEAEPEWHDGEIIHTGGQASRA